MSQTIRKTLQLSDLLAAFGVKHTVEMEKVATELFSFLVYLKPGEVFQLSQVKFSKLSSDVLHLEVNDDLEMLADSLEKRKIIRLAT